MLNHLLDLAVGHRLPSAFPSAVVLGFPMGMIAVDRDDNPSPGQIEAVRRGPWSLSLLPGGMHATLIHLRFGVPGTPHGGDIGHHSDFPWGSTASIRRGFDPEAVLEDDLSVAYALADQSGFVRAVRFGMIPAADMAFLRTEIARHGKVRAIWSADAQERGVRRELVRLGSPIPRSAFPCWIDIPKEVPGEAG